MNTEYGQVMTKQENKINKQKKTNKNYTKYKIPKKKWTVQTNKTNKYYMKAYAL